MIALYTRLHREEQAARRAAGEEPSGHGPMRGLLIGCGISLVAWIAIVAVVTIIGALVS